MRDRAVSTTLNYVFSLAIAGILMTGLLLGGGTFVQDRQEQVLREELSVIGEQIVSDLHRADRLALASDGNTEVRINNTLPDQIAGTTYRVLLEAGDAEVQLTSTDPVIAVDVPVQTETGLADSSAGGGTIQVRLSGGDLEVRNG